MTYKIRAIFLLRVLNIWFITKWNTIERWTYYYNNRIIYTLANNIGEYTRPETEHMTYIMWGIIIDVKKYIY